MNGNDVSDIRLHAAKRMPRRGLLVQGRTDRVDP